jgi:hypothetical protein
VIAHAPTVEAREAAADLVSSILLAHDAYRGFQYVDEDGYAVPGDVIRGKAQAYDESRRRYW